MKIIFMGTPDFSVGTLEALVEAGHEVVLAVTQPDNDMSVQNSALHYKMVSQSRYVVFLSFS